MFVFIYVQKYATSIADFYGNGKNTKHDLSHFFFNNTHARNYWSSKNIIISWEHANNIDAPLRGFIKYPFALRDGILQIPRGREVSKPLNNEYKSQSDAVAGEGRFKPYEGVDIVWNNILPVLKYPENFRQ